MRFFARAIPAKIDDERWHLRAYVSPSSSLAVLNFRKSLVDPVHERFCNQWIKPDSIVWDIGGNLGLFALPAALKAKAGRTYAFEPDLELAHNLLRSSMLPRNRNLNISVMGVAVSKGEGVANFQISKFSRAMNKLEAVGAWHQGQVEVEQLRSVPTMSIDTLAKTLSPPTVLKIDVEGAEMDVLHGGEMTISRHRPTILIEGPEELWDQMQAFFDKHQYALFDGDSEKPSPSPHPVWNTVAVPRERISA